MPIFEYLCEDCGSKFEKLVRRPGVDEVLCPTCGEGGHLEQQLSTFAAHSSSASFDPGPGSCPSGMCATPGLCGRETN